MSQNKRPFILVGGVGRSGTSILAKLLASTRNSEFFYEPPVFMHILEDFKNWAKYSRSRGILETILYKDLMKGALSGRALNLNRNDISSVYNYKDDSEIESRFIGSFRQDQLKGHLKESSGIIKVLDNIQNFQELNNIVPVFKAVVIIRNPVSTAKSLLNKGWFSNNQLDTSSPEPLRPMIVKNNRRYHYFLHEEMHDKWDHFSEMERVGYYYQYHFSSFKNLLNDENVMFIRYESLIEKTDKVFNDLLKKTHLTLGAKSKLILNSVKFQTSNDSKFESEFMSSPYGESCMALYNDLSKKSV